MRRVNVMIACLALMTNPGRAVFGEEPENTYSKALASTVYITSIDRDWNTSHGTGVVASRAMGGLIATAYHVVGEHNLVCASMPLMGPDGALITDAASYSALNDASLCVVVASDPAKDLALIRFRQPRKLPEMPLARHSARPGQNVFTIGNDPTQSMFHFASGSIRQVYNGSYAFKSGQTIRAKLVESTIPYNGGDSGGPIFNISSGELLGINSGSVSNANQVNNGIDVSEVRALLIKTLEAQIQPATKTTTTVVVEGDAQK
jgi:S1-C subfamily serine protease